MLTGAKPRNLLAVKSANLIVVEVVHPDKNTIVGGSGPLDGSVSATTNRKMGSCLAEDLEAVCNFLGGLWGEDTPG